MLLAIDTSTRNIGIALYTGERVLSEMFWSSPNYHTVELAPAVESMLEKARSGTHDLTAVGVAIGPGSYTGLRIGLAFAKGLAFSHHLPIIGIPTLDILAAAQPTAPLALAAVLEAGRNRYSVGWYRIEDEKWVPTDQLENMDIDDFAKSVQEPTRICGEISEDMHARLQQLGENIEIASPAESMRRPAVLAEIAWQRWQAGQVDDPTSLAPQYLHSGDPIPG
ncbi:MAG: tRNA (adenosine(37)-N6)-threonylcarbamoyltransferase complex dimerization subunit type 1 TsaB [Chloroflexota bacterium]